MKSEPLLLLFAENGLVTYVCHSCVKIETRNCATEKKFATFVKEMTSIKGECKECNSLMNLFKNPHGQQYWINYKED